MKRWLIAAMIIVGCACCVSCKSTSVEVCGEHKGTKA